MLRSRSIPSPVYVARSTDYGIQYTVFRLCCHDICGFPLNAPFNTQHKLTKIVAERGIHNTLYDALMLTISGLFPGLRKRGSRLPLPPVGMCTLIRRCCLNCLTQLALFTSKFASRAQRCQQFAYGGYQRCTLYVRCTDSLLAGPPILYPTSVSQWTKMMPYNSYLVLGTDMCLHWLIMPSTYGYVRSTPYSLSRQFPSGLDLFEVIELPPVYRNHASYVIDLCSSP